jgi:WXG100 family type VII secretion target
MDPRLSYNFDEIEASVRQEIHTASARFNAALQELRAQVAPLHELWTREAATAYQVEQVKWHQAGADDVAAADRRAAGVWARTGR